MTKIRYKDLSLPLKLGIIGGLACFVYIIVAFLIGFSIGLIGAM